MFKPINNHGFSKIQIILAITLIIIVTGGSFYFFKKSNNNQSSSPLTADNKSIEAACMKHFDDSDFCRFASRWSMDENVIMKFTSLEDDSIMEMRSSGNDTHTIVTEHGDIVSEMIVLKGTSYIKNMDDNTWQKFGDDNKDIDYSSDYMMPNFDFDEDITETQTINKLGKEACGDLTCFKYELIDTDEEGSKSTLWFDDKDYKLRHISSTDSHGTGEATFSYEKVIISEPSPIVEIPNLEGADLNNDSTDMSIEEIQRQLQSIQ